MVNLYGRESGDVSPKHIYVAVGKVTSYFPDYSKDNAPSFCRIDDIVHTLSFAELYFK